MKAIDAFPPEERRPISAAKDIYRVFTLLIFLHIIYMDSIPLFSIISLFIFELLVRLFTLFMKAIDAFPPVEKRPICAQWDIYGVFTPQRRHVQRGSQFF